MVERRPEARPRSACGRGFRPVFGRSRPGSFLDFLRSKTRKDSFLLSCFQWSICKGYIYFFNGAINLSCWFVIHIKLEFLHVREVYHDPHTLSQYIENFEYPETVS